jgi:hypothetical protein
MKRLVVFFLLFFLFVPSVKAQDLESSAAAVEPVVVEATDTNLKTDLIWQRARLDEEIASVKATYQAQLENYLYQDKLYRIAYDQYQQLQTLVSIEDLTQKGKNLGISRDEVLISYLDLLRLNLVATEGIELALKTKYLTQLENTVFYLKNHQENLKNLNGRDQVASSLATFAFDQAGVGSLANEVLVLLSVGKLQMVYDKSFALKKDIDVYLQEKGTLELPEIDRASLETNRSLESAKLKLDVFWADLLERGGSSGYLAKFYDELPRTLNPIYVNLSQSISYLSELLTI